MLSLGTIVGYVFDSMSEDSIEYSVMTFVSFDSGIIIEREKPVAIEKWEENNFLLPMNPMSKLDPEFDNI